MQPNTERVVFVSRSTDIRVVWRLILKPPCFWRVCRALPGSRWFYGPRCVCVATVSHVGRGVQCTIPIPVRNTGEKHSAVCEWFWE